MCDGVTLRVCEGDGRDPMWVCLRAGVLGREPAVASGVCAEPAGARLGWGAGRGLRVGVSLPRARVPPRGAALKAAVPEPQNQDSFLGA